MPELLTSTLQTVGVTASLAGAGGMAALSFLDMPMLQSQPAERSLPMIRWLFSRGSHMFPQAGTVSSLAFAYLAFDALPIDTRSLNQFLSMTNGFKVNSYLAAAALAFSIYPFTRFIMVPNNFAMMDKNQEKGGAWSRAEAKSARAEGKQPGQTGGEEFKDVSGPQEITDLSLSAAEQREVWDMLEKFSVQNIWRAALLLGSGVLGLSAATH